MEVKEEIVETMGDPICAFARPMAQKPFCGEVVQHIPKVEIKDVLQSRGLHLGMRLDTWPPAVLKNDDRVLMR